MECARNVAVAGNRAVDIPRVTLSRMSQQPPHRPTHIRDHDLCPGIHCRKLRREATKPVGWPPFLSASCFRHRNAQSTNRDRGEGPRHDYSQPRGAEGFQPVRQPPPVSPNRNAIKTECVGSFWNLHAEGFRAALAIEVLVQLQAQLAHVHPHRTIFSGAVAMVNLPKTACPIRCSLSSARSPQME